MERIKFHSKFIRQRRLQKGWTQTQLGEAIGVNFRTISEIEKGRQGIKLHRVPHLAKALDVAIHDVCELPEYLTFTSIN